MSSQYASVATAAAFHHGGAAFDDEHEMPSGTGAIIIVFHFAVIIYMNQS